MAHPDDLLGPGERVVIHKHPHWKALSAPVAVLLVVVLGGTWLAGPVSALSWAPTAWLVLAAVAAVLVAWLVVAPVLRWGTTHFIVTDERVMCRMGVFSRARLNLPLAMVRGVRFRQGAVDRLLGCGTLVVDPADPVGPADGPLEFDDVPGVVEVRATLERVLGGAHRQEDRSTDGRA
ncbi:PH domain-containing protein [Saccharothrix syringae]|uniref:PH domain-containing protein n=1 Tax=Saccharothrix syringae TaxID=103733 RepID=A0A5Q0HC69_SACSY|nr:PH domain-containing protein [Saccharothrix syringae]QFZ23252.1 PH domain-containing protein [Saccharothrix syringae]